MSAVYDAKLRRRVKAAARQPPDSSARRRLRRPARARPTRRRRRSGCCAGSASTRSACRRCPRRSRCGTPACASLGISTITNMAAGILKKPLNHDEVLETTQRVGSRFVRLLDGRRAEDRGTGGGPDGAALDRPAPGEREKDSSRRRPGTGERASRSGAASPWAPRSRIESGTIWGGCNVENSTYGLTVCAERVAIWKALSEGRPAVHARWPS